MLEQVKWAKENKKSAVLDHFSGSTIMGISCLWKPSF
jgi:hypothetical protein